MVTVTDSDYEDSDADEDLSIRSLEVTKSPCQNDLLPLLECPVCLDLPLPPIRTCCQGHILCATCCPKLAVCPLCQQHIGTGRNFFAEDFLNRSVMRCKFHVDGCLEEIPGAKMKEHIEECRYRPVKCRQCQKRIGYSDIEDHLQKEHNISQWDLNEEGARIVMCQKMRSRNPGAASALIEARYETIFGYSKYIKTAAILIAFLALDFYLIDETELAKGYFFF